MNDKNNNFEKLCINFEKKELTREFKDERKIEAIIQFGIWCDKQKQHYDLPIRSRVYAALVTLDRLLKNYNLERKEHTTSSGAQVKMQTPHNVKKILARFGETRPIPTEAGRTSRGSLHAVEELLESLQSTKLDELDKEDRNTVLSEMIKHLVWISGEYHERARIAIEYNPTRNATQIISDALDSAEYKAGAVAQHLVGAKLQLRLSDIEVANHGYSTADIQTGRRGDFEINDTIFHVTVAPNDGHYKKCADDIRNGYRVYLLVKDDLRVGAEQIAHTNHSEFINVQSIESFIGQNLDELSVFSKNTFKLRFRKLLKLYNERVSAVEADKSLLIEIPANLNS